MRRSDIRKAPAKGLTNQEKAARAKAIKARRRAWLEGAHARNPRCRYCAMPTELMPRTFNATADADCESRHATLDHIFPLSRGGQDNPSNWALACNACKLLKGDMTETSYIALLKAEGIR